MLRLIRGRMTDFDESYSFIENEVIIGQIDKNYFLHLVYMEKDKILSTEYPITRQRFESLFNKLQHTEAYQGFNLDEFKAKKHSWIQLHVEMALNQKILE